MKTLTLAALLAFSPAWAKLPPPPPVDPAKAEEAKQKAAEAAKKGAELQARYEDRAAAAFAAKAKAEGREFKPQLGTGIQPPPAPPAAAPTAAAPAAPPKDAKAAPRK